MPVQLGFAVICLVLDVRGLLLFRLGKSQSHITRPVLYYLKSSPDNSLSKQRSYSVLEQKKSCVCMQACPHTATKDFDSVLRF